MTSGEGRPPGWDFFISYTQEDRSWAEWVAWVLEEADHKVLVQAWDFVPGTNWIQSMQEGVAKSDRTIAILSSAYLGSQYGTAEWEAAWAADPAGRNRKLLPIRVQDCGRPGLLGGVVGVDLFNMTEAEAKARLLAMISTALSDRARPTCAPTFPGRAVPHEPRFPGALPAIWKVPPPNPNFAGRGEDLNALKTALADTSVVTVQSLRGMGGVGKSQLAAEFAHNHAADYDLVYWISAGNTATIPDQFSALAVQLNLNPEPNPVALREQVHKRLHDVAGWLLIFDNAGTVAGIRDWIPSDPLPAGVPGHVIVTTRRAGFRALGSVTELDVLDPASSAELLQSRVPDLAEDTARDIAKELGHLPLALEQASAYLEQTSIPPGDYLELLRHGSEEIFGRGEVTGHEGTIATLWNIALDRIAAEAPAAIALLNLCAWLAPEPIPLDLFTIHVDLLPEPLAAAAASPVAFNDAVGTLTDYSLAKRTESGLQLHRLVQWAIRAWHASVSGTLGVSETLGTVFRLLIDDVQGKAADAPEYWPRWTILLPHVLTATGDFDWSPFISTDSGQDDASWLLQRAAAYLDVRARLDEALLLAERAVTITENAHGPDHPAVASRLNSLAIILRDLGRATEAKSLAERTIRIAEATHGPEHPDVASGLNTLAVILHDLRRPADGQPLIERALTITENAHGPDHPTVGIRLNNLAVILDDLKQPGKALSPANRALAIAEAAHDTDHPEVAGRLNNLAVILRNLRRTTEAKSLAERALAITETIHGPDHYEVCIPLCTLASVLWELGEQESAIQLAKRAKAIRQAHPHLPLRPARGKNPDALPEDASLTHQTDHQIQFRRFENQTEDPPGSAF